MNAIVVDATLSFSPPPSLSLLREEKEWWSVDWRSDVNLIADHTHRVGEKINSKRRLKTAISETELQWRGWWSGGAFVCAEIVFWRLQKFNQNTQVCVFEHTAAHVRLLEVSSVDGIVWTYEREKCDSDNGCSNRFVHLLLVILHTVQ